MGFSLLMAACCASACKRLKGGRCLGLSSICNVFLPPCTGRGGGGVGVCGIWLMHVNVPLTSGAAPEHSDRLVFPQMLLQLSSNPLHAVLFQFHTDIAAPAGVGLGGQLHSTCCSACL